MQHDRADEPHEHVGGVAHVDELEQGEAGQRERGEVRERVQRRGAVAAHARPSEGQRPHPLGVVHAGERGHDDASGEAVVGREVGAVHLQREQRARRCRTACGSASPAGTCRGPGATRPAARSRRRRPPRPRGPRAARRSSAAWSSTPRRRRSAASPCAAPSRAVRRGSAAARARPSAGRAGTVAGHLAAWMPRHRRRSC